MDCFHQLIINHGPGVLFVIAFVTGCLVVVVCYAGTLSPSASSPGRAPCFLSGRSRLLGSDTAEGPLARYLAVGEQQLDTLEDMMSDVFSLVGSHRLRSDDEWKKNVTTASLAVQLTQSELRQKIEKVDLEDPAEQVSVIEAGDRLSEALDALEMEFDVCREAKLELASKLEDVNIDMMRVAGELRVAVAELERTVLDGTKSSVDGWTV
jgi:hypothetical protein